MNAVVGYKFPAKIKLIMSNLSDFVVEQKNYFRCVLMW